MRSETELLLLPYSSADGDSLLSRVIREFQEGNWKEFRGAIAFVRHSGNFPDLLSSIEAFAQDDDHHALFTFGADIFGSRARGSDYEAIQNLLEAFEERPNVRFYLYHEKGRTFHPKIYLFSDEPGERALLFVGSSNWTEGGLVQNIEASIIVHFDLAREDNRDCYDRLISYFKKYWSEQDA